MFHDRTKHIEVDCHFTRDKVLEGLLQLSYLLANILTKVLPSPQFNSLLGKLGMVYPHSSVRGGVKYSTQQGKYICIKDKCVKQHQTSVWSTS